MQKSLILKIGLLALTALTLSCASNKKMKEGCACNKDQAQQLSTGTPYYEYHKIYFSKAPTRDDLAAFKQMGIKVVVDLRDADELKATAINEQEIAKDLKLDYFNVAISRDKALDQSELQAVESKVMEHHKNHAILVHCSTGQRAAAWFAYHNQVHHKANPKKAMKMAKKVGLKDEKMKAKVKNYLKAANLQQ